jgi:hypothetical protein
MRGGEGTQERLGTVLSQLRDTDLVTALDGSFRGDWDCSGLHRALPRCLDMLRATPDDEAARKALHLLWPVVRLAVPTPAARPMYDWVVAMLASRVATFWYARDDRRRPARALGAWHLLATRYLGYRAETGFPSARLAVALGCRIVLEIRRSFPLLHADLLAAGRILDEKYRSGDVSDVTATGFWRAVRQRLAWQSGRSILGWVAAILGAGIPLLWLCR